MKEMQTILQDEITLFLTLFPSIHLKNVENIGDCILNVSITLSNIFYLNILLYFVYVDRKITLK